MRLEPWHLAALVFPVLSILHLYLSPYTKVEESFNIQATHNILTYGIPTENVHLRFKAQYDHMTFPGAVPRTFIGALLLSGLAKPFSSYFHLSLPDQQFLVRAILGLLNATALSYYAYGVQRAFGRSTAFWYILLQASQFHVFYYASRPLPNMFAFALSTFALRFLLPDPASTWSQSKRTRLALYILTLTTIVFRAELALLLFSYCATFIASAIYHSNSIPTLLRTTILPAILAGGFAGLVLTIPIDTYFWRQSVAPSTLLWPELSAFLSNIFPSATASNTNPLGASAWGTSPFHWYFTSAIPRLLINPFLLIPLLFSFTSYFPHRPTTTTLLLTSLQFTLLYSLLSHKETRFIFPIIPSLTTSLALSISYMSTHRIRSKLYTLLTQTLLLTTLLTTLLSHLILTPLSALSYPGAHALTSLHAISSIYRPQRTITVHLSNLALQTGITHFLQLPPAKSPLVILPGSTDGRYPEIRTGGTLWIYDKSDNATGVYTEERFWRQFDYVIVEDVQHPLPVRGWDVVDTIYGIGRPRLLGKEEGRGFLLGGGGRDGGRERDGVMRVLEGMYGDGVLGRVVVGGYAAVHDVLREGWGVGRWSLTGGRWVHWGMERRLFVMKRGEGMGRREWNP